MKNKNILLLICFILISVSNIAAQYKADKCADSKSQHISGNLNFDLFANTNIFLTDTVASIYHERKYSPLQAGLFSAVIPGAGQLYTESYWQSAAFFSAEVLSWVLYAIYENKGDRQTELFQKYADERWSVVRYVKWIEQYYFYSSANIIKGSPSDDVAQPWNYIDWQKLNFYEEEIGKQRSGFSHRLAPYGDQQYYEMIGKYSQFIGGWDDAWNGGLSLYGIQDVLAENVSANFLKYSDMRGEANSFYNIATTVSYIIVANHIFSALEAAWNASMLNQKIQLEGHIQPRIIYGNMVEYVPTFCAKYSF